MFESTIILLSIENGKQWNSTAIAIAKPWMKLKKLRIRCSLSQVCQARHDALPHLRMLVTPGVADGNKVALYLELQNKINAAQVSLAGINESGFYKADERKQLLDELKDMDVVNCSWEFLESLPLN